MLEKYLDSAKVNSQIESDYQLSQLLGVTRSHLSRMRDGTRLPSDELMLRLAELGKKSKEAALLDLAQMKAVSDEARKVYEGLMRKIGITILLVALPFFSLCGSAQASFSQVSTVSVPMVKKAELPSIYYAQL